MKTVLKTLFTLTLFIILTITTQIGGVLYVLSICIAKRLKVQLKYNTLIAFIVLYLMSTLIIVPAVAPLFGRETVTHTAGIKPTNFMTVLLNRNYVRPELNKLLTKTARALEGTDIKIRYLDANFPFINAFPLLPHLSHNDGKKIDLSLIYETPNGNITQTQKSVSGYGVFEAPKPNEYNQVETCLNSGYFQYDYPKYLTLGKINSDLIFSERGTKLLIETLLRRPGLGKLFIEPHLKHRMHLKNDKIRYHGCGAVRHDDHIHIQLK
ncbi:hypothetical protein AST99_10025 [Formosa algae]|nr:hypothetical protein AST99_10025 [Formosa algae]